MLRMLVTGGDERRRQGIARSIGRRGPIRVELAGSLECGIGLLEWRRYDLVGAFAERQLGARFAEACVLQQIAPQLVIFGQWLQGGRLSVESELRRAGLPQPIFVPGTVDEEDPSAFWKSLVGSILRGNAASDVRAGPCQAARATGERVEAGD